MMFNKSAFVFRNLIPTFLIIYLICSVSFGLVMQRLFKTADPRTIGSGNIGATNMMRTGNKKAGLLTFVGDFLKGYLCCIFFNLTFTEMSSSFIYEQMSLLTFYPLFFTTLWLLVPVIAHVFPVWTDFKGGKGIATAFGVLIAFNYLVGLIGLGIWLTTFVLSKVSSIAGLLFALLTPLICYLILGLNYTYWSIILSGFIMYTHRENIIKLINGDENNFKRG